MSTTPQVTGRPRERLLPALLIGLAAGLMGSLALAQLNPQGALGITAAIYAVVSFGGALGAIQFAPSNFLEVGGLMCAGVAVGVFLSVLVHPMVGGGERNLWPFEILLFWVVGAIPLWLGLVIGRFLNARRKRVLERAV